MWRNVVPDSYSKLVDLLYLYSGILTWLLPLKSRQVLCVPYWTPNLLPTPTTLFTIKSGSELVTRGPSDLTATVHPPPLYVYQNKIWWKVRLSFLISFLGAYRTAKGFCICTFVQYTVLQCLHFTCWQLQPAFNYLSIYFLAASFT